MILPALLQTMAVCMAQTGDLIPVNVWNIYSTATGISNASAEVLWPESFINTSEAEELYSSIESYTGDPDQEISKVISEMKEGLATVQKLREDLSQGKGVYEGMNISPDEKKEFLAELDAQIAATKENIAYYSSMDTSGAPDPKELLAEILKHSVNGKVYHGVLSLGNGLWAVSESANEDGPNHACLGGWGVIDASGKTVTGFKYDLIMEADEEHGIIKYGTGYRGKGTLYGLLKFNGAQALPCEYDQIYFSEGNYIAAVLPNAAHAYLYDWNMNRLSTADICYSEPWTRGTSDRKVTYYPAIDRNGKVGVYDDSGKLVVPFIYDRCYSDGEYLFGVTGPFPKKVTGFSINFDHIESFNEAKYDIFTWKRL